MTAQFRIVFDVFSYIYMAFVHVYYVRDIEKKEEKKSKIF